MKQVRTAMIPVAGTGMEQGYAKVSLPREPWIPAAPTVPVPPKPRTRFEVVVMSPDPVVQTRRERIAEMVNAGTAINDVATAVGVPRATVLADLVRMKKVAC